MHERGVAHFLAAERIDAVVERVPVMGEVLSAAVMLLLGQVARTAHANAHGCVLERVARWLLGAHDRTDADELLVTHDTLSRMLGVRRVGVTNALHVLEGDRLVQARRGRVRVLDRAGLILVANGLYPACDHADMPAPPRLDDAAGGDGAWA